MSQENDIAEALITAFKNGNKFLVCGNGGSATMSEHWAGELVGKFQYERKPLPAIALTNLAVITAIANDYDYTQIFSRQVEAFGKKGDVFVGLTTSGTSANVVRAYGTAVNLGLHSFMLPPHTNKDLSTAQCQLLHLDKIHRICKTVEEAFI